MGVADGRRTTLATIAEAAGVSLPTVSKVLNGKQDVAPATRARIQQLLVDYDYVPVSDRRRPNSSDLLVDLVFSALDSPWAIEIIRGVTSSDLSVVVSSMDAAGDSRRWADSLVAAGRHGALIVTSDLTAAARRTLQRAGLPIVVIDPVDLPEPEIASVGATNWAGGLSATKHLLQLGHRRIAMIGGPAGFLCSRARIDGYRAALDQVGIEVDSRLIRHGNFHHEGGYAEALVVLQLDERPTAVFAGSDEQALGVIQAVRACGLRVPEDVSVVGFDDLPVGRWASPPLTTVRQPLAEMGRVAARMLQSLIAGEPLDSNRVELATTLVLRSSTTAPPSG